MSEVSVARRRASLSVEEAARLSGYSVASVRQYEKPSFAAPHQAALRLAQLYGCAPTCFLKQSHKSSAASRKDR